VSEVSEATGGRREAHGVIHSRLGAFVMMMGDVVHRHRFASRRNCISDSIRE
jgi:hypothetical protein